MKKLNWTHKALYHGMSTLTSGVWSAMYIVARDVMRAGTTALMQTNYGVTSLPVVSPQDNMADSPLRHAFILDTEEDIATKLALVCNACGNELEIVAIEEVPESAIVLQVLCCETCSNNTHQHAFNEGLTERTRGF